VVLKVTDDDGLVGIANVSVMVTELPNQAPKVVIGSPVAGTTITVTTLDITGTASDPDGNIEYIEVQVDTLGWARANGTSSWTYAWDGANLSEGPHTISARAYDGRVYSDIASFNITMKKDGGGGGGGKKKGPGFEAASMAIAMIVAVLVGTALARRRGRDGRKEIG